MRPLRTLLLALFISFCWQGFAQQSYTINGETLSLKTEVSGTIDLLWNTFDKKYRYFVKKDGQYYELTNTRVDKKYQDEYKDTMAQLTAGSGMSTDKLRLTLANLRSFINKYNASVDPGYQYNSETVKIEHRLGFFGGITNNRYTSNPPNAIAPVIGIEYEILDRNMLPSHALVAQFRQVFPTEEFDYTSSQVSVNYRFKYVKARGLDLYANVRIATYTYSETVIPADPAVVGSQEIRRSGGSFQAPLLLGLGADLKLGNGYLMFAYNDFVGFLESNGEFPTDFTIGYKFNL